MQHSVQESKKKAPAESGNFLSKYFIGAVALLSIIPGCAPKQGSLGGKEAHLKAKQQTFSRKVARAEQFFKEGKYGNAEQAYRLAIEENPNSVEAWLGIAAAYDHLKKFKNANRAYSIAIKLEGYTPEILNNLGYHYILRGHYGKARKALTAADRKEPENPYIQNNLRILSEHEGKAEKPEQTAAY